MNPRVLFDKSIFQSTPVSAFVTVDRYFEIVIPPILVREIGGDLAGTTGQRKEQDQTAFVQKLAHRPGVRAFLPHHALLISQNILGYPIPMDGRIMAMMDPGQTPDGMAGLHVTVTPEEYALNRWRQRDFSENDHLWARRWQRVKKFVPTGFYRQVLGQWGVTVEQPRNLEELRQRIEEIMRNPAVQPGLLRIIFSDFAVGEEDQALACKRYQSKKPRQLMEEFAPYAALCLKANLLLAFGGEMLKQPHPHDLRDIEYCYYLPFCEIFASDDRLHRKLVPMLMRPNQTLVRSDLIEDLRRLTDEWSAMTPEQKVEFVRNTHNIPPEREGSVVRELWVQYRGPTAPRPEPNYQQPDEFFRALIRKHYGSEDVLNNLNVEQAAYVVQKTEMSLERLRELYPGVDF